MRNGRKLSKVHATDSQSECSKSKLMSIQSHDRFRHLYTFMCFWSSYLHSIVDAVFLPIWFLESTVDILSEHIRDNGTVNCHLLVKSLCLAFRTHPVSLALKNSTRRCIKDNDSSPRLTNLHKSQTMPVAVIQYEWSNYSSGIGLGRWSALHSGWVPDGHSRFSWLGIPCHCVVHTGCETCMWFGIGRWQVLDTFIADKS